MKTMSKNKMLQQTFEDLFILIQNRALSHKKYKDYSSLLDLQTATKRMKYFLVEVNYFDTKKFETRFI